ncbi:transglutaminase domain-containing protein [Frankia sp. CNm7]|uniref:Transglutaminase domain-containing protein n=1 Tax=Frankia nepalensis TaxID=1836974 RepID=A0A937RP99_9ACTN|nr:transglutaminaseTgpA domain-containing protein [Frankia nepalensis]MBL7501608.1 transglutaminase domain-containing protein [Frankia nepalensis]MBL7513385.1 transglutaminase domain-containing protein [Frankia nepalensis]MBL7521058.1 transglutaminase domain-containing protein [Frankia nepalensis]MBL7633697.1 transglutaminase domain-containing protein [Frankia nepalensis]
MTRPVAVGGPAGHGDRRLAAYLSRGRARGQTVPTVVGAAASLLCASALHPLFRGFFWWFGPVLLATLVVVGLAALGRRFGLGPATTLVLSLFGLLFALTVLCAGDEAVLGVVPTPASLGRLVDLMSAGRADMSRLSAPVPERPGLVVLTVLGVASVAILVDLLTVGLGRPTLAGLPLLGLFAVPSAVLPRGVGAGAFTLGVVGFLALLLLDGRSVVRRWGQLVSTRARGRTNLWLGGLAGRVALGALLVAVVAPLAVPSLDGHGLIQSVRDSESDDGSGGGSQAQVPQPMASLAQRLHDDPDHEVMTVRPSNPNEPMRLRQVALEEFTGDAFTLRKLTAEPDSRIDRGLPRPPSGLTTTKVSAEISLRPDYPDLYLPVPGIPTAISGLKGDWRVDEATSAIFATRDRTSTAGISYTVTAAVPTPSKAELAVSGQAPSEPALQYDTRLPGDLDPRVRELAQSLAAGKATGYDKVRAIQDYFHGGTFTYDLSGAPSVPTGALSEFLFVGKKGYCEQFASAMTVLVRALGIPARVAVGFLGGTRAADGSWVVKNQDAHAWPEVWLPGTGWIPFEPTPLPDSAVAGGTGGSQPPTGPTQNPTPATPGVPTPGQAQPEPANPRGQSGSGLVDGPSTTPGGQSEPGDSSFAQPLVSVRTDNPELFRTTVYLRETALDTFDGSSRFTSSGFPGAGDTSFGVDLPRPTVEVAGTEVTATISIHPGNPQTELPLPDGRTTSVEGLQGVWWVNQPTGTVYANARTSAAGAVYTVQAVIPTPTKAQLTATGTIPAELAPDLAVPADLDSRIPDLAEQITSGRASDYDKARAIADYFQRQQWVYDVAAPLGTVSDFLFVTHRGFCEHYATAMALLARTLDIPARVATGYKRPTQQPDGSLLYKQGNRHAWPEVWLPGAGWVPFEPTNSNGVPPDTGDNTWSPDPDQRQTEIGQDVAASPEVTPGTDGAGADGGTASRTGKILLRAALILLIVVGGAALLGGPAIARRVIRRRRLRASAVPSTAGPPAEAGVLARARVRAGWAELLDLATDLGIPLRPSDSPRMVVGRLKGYLVAGPEAETPKVADAVKALERLGWAEERVRYAPPGTQLGQAGDSVTEDVTTATDGLLSVAPRGRWLVAQVAPPSVLRRLTRSGGYAAAERPWRRSSGPPAPTAPEPRGEPAEPAGRP